MQKTIDRTITAHRAGSLTRARVVLDPDPLGRLAELLGEPELLEARDDLPADRVAERHDAG